MVLFYQLADQHAWQDVRIPCFKSAASPTRTVRAGGKTETQLLHLVVLSSCRLSGIVD